ncbi:GNAT family N-acetyltransferase [Thalassotalea euphylliae]|uniref:GNAT family N-acetyltransferase n=1 Tax=Thalassotalea euphylliae TaxID=1655234 RepID=UPI00363099C7
MEFPEIDTPRLMLNALTKEDAPAIFTLFSDPKVVEYYDLAAFTELAQAEKLINFFVKRYEDNIGIRWAIRFKDTGELIGTCGFNGWNTAMKSSPIGYDLMSQYWGKGLVTEVLHPILALAFEGALPCGELNRIQADTIPGNVGSEKVLLKLGFKEEGLRRQAGYWKDAFHDLKCFGLIKSDFA